MTRHQMPSREKKANREKAIERQVHGISALFNTGASLPCGVHLASPCGLTCALKKSLY